MDHPSKIISVDKKDRKGVIMALKHRDMVMGIFGHSTAWEVVEYRRGSPVDINRKSRRTES